MNYLKRSVNGDAGEHLVAYKVKRILGWPCRLLDVDIGVDAEMEALDEHLCSTGDFIKIQIKSYDSLTDKIAKGVYVDGKHIEYWKRCSVPIIVCCVDLQSSKVYWKSITATDSYASSGEANVVRFDLHKDELKAADAAALRALVTPKESKLIEPLFAQLRTLHEQLLASPDLAVDGEQLNAIENLCEAANQIVRQISELQRHFPWRLGVLAVRELAIMERNIQIVENNARRSFATVVNGM